MGIEPIPAHRVKINSFVQVSNSQSNSFYQHQAKTVRELVLSLLTLAASSIYSPQPGVRRASR